MISKFRKGKLPGIFSHKHFSTLLHCPINDRPIFPAPNNTSFFILKQVYQEKSLTITSMILVVLSPGCSMGNAFSFRSALRDLQRTLQGSIPRTYSP